MTRPRRTIRYYLGFLLTGTFLFQVTLLPAQSIPIAVLDFDGFGISQTEAIALSNRLRNELFKLGTFEVVDRGMMESILAEQDFQMAGCTSNECLVEVGQLLGARQMVGGSISKVGETFTVSARIVDVETGKVLRVSDYDLQGDLDLLLTRGMGVVAARLGAAEAPRAPDKPPSVRETDLGAISPPATSVQTHPWQPLIGLTPRGQESLSMLLSYDIPAKWRLWLVDIQPFLSIGSLHQGYYASDFDIADSSGWSEDEYEDMYYGLLGVAARWATPDESLRLAAYVATGAGIFDYYYYFESYQEFSGTYETLDYSSDEDGGLGWIFTTGAQVGAKLPVIPTLVIDTRFLLTPVLGPSMAVSLGMQLNTWQVGIVAGGFLMILVGAD